MKNIYLKFQDNYSIDFSKLDEKIHNFEFQVNDKFFDFFEYSEIKKGLIDINVEIQKQYKIIYLKLFFTGRISTICDRCLENIDLPIDNNFNLIIKQGDKNTETTEDVIIISEAIQKIYLSQYIYEFIHLCLPL